MKHTTLYLVCITVLGILLTASTLALAQRAAPPPDNASAEMDELSPSISLGQPGLSYRYVKSIGTLGVPYLADTTHLNRPMGLFIDNSDNIYITEELGHRVLKYDSGKVNLLDLGIPGLCEGYDRGFCYPKDVTVDKNGNLWVVDPHRAVQYSPAGVYMQQFPDTDPWMAGSGNDRFDDPNGVAFDSVGRMYISDTMNQRIQVFEMTTGTPVYSTTIGVTDVISDTAGYFYDPVRVAIDPSDRLYVVERGNDRVQKCSFSSGWNCTVVDDTLNDPLGITADDSGNVYIADAGNGRLRKCTSAGSCSTFVEWWGAQDVAVDSSGNVYSTDSWGAIVDKFNPGGEHQGIYLGVGQTPYLTDSNHFNHARVAIDHEDNLLILEEHGQRLIKLDKDGNVVFSFGVPGVDDQDDTHLANPRALATDSIGRIYVANGCQVKIFTKYGIYMVPLGTGCGIGDYEFSWVTGVDVDKNGNIYVADFYNHRVQIYNSSLVFKDRIGVTGECGPAHDRLCNPIGVETDYAGNIYVTEAGNVGVQKFNSSLQWQMTIGDGTSGDSFSQFAIPPEDVAVDAQGRIFVADWYNNRVQIFDPAGKYLTTIGGGWGTSSNLFNGLSGVDVDSKGNVYIADWDNFLIKVFAPGVPAWRQANINGFGSPNQMIAAFEEFNDYLYAGNTNWEDQVGRVYRTLNGSDWELVDKDFEAWGVSSLITFENQLYAGTWSQSNPGIWSSPDGLRWTKVMTDSLELPIASLSQFDGTLYAGTYCTASEGATIWKSSDGINWSPFITNGNGDPNACGVISSAEFAGDFYFGVADISGIKGGRIWRSDGLTVTEVVGDGFGNPKNSSPSGLAAFENWLYASISNVSSIQVWRTDSGDPKSWSMVFETGQGEPGLKNNSGLIVHNNRLILTVENDTSGLQVWGTTDGLDWVHFGFDGFGDSNNFYTQESKSLAVFKDRLYIGAINFYNGGEVWQYVGYPVYLPMIRK